MENNEKQTGKINRTVPINMTRKGGKRLRPILDCLLDESVSIAELGNRIGLTRQSLNRWFIIDDAKLTQLESVAEALGYELRWGFVKKEEE